MDGTYDFLALAAERYSVRKFRQQPLEERVLNQILQAGHVAPTACNRQPQRILVLNGPEDMEKLRRCTKCHFDAPAAMLVCCHRGECWQRPWDGKSSGDIDASIVATHLMLAASAQGVGSTWVMYFEADALRAEFSIPAEVEPIALLVMGYPAPDAAPLEGHTAFRAPEELVAYHRFD